MDSGASNGALGLQIAARKAAYEVLTVYTRKYGMYGVPIRSDPRWAAFFDDEAACGALRTYFREDHLVYKLRHPERQREVAREANRRWRASDIEHAREVARANGHLYYERHPERVLANCRAWAANNPERNRKIRAGINRRRHLKFREALNARNREWYKQHPGKHAEYSLKSRARRVGADGSYTQEEFRELCSIFEYRCAYCGRAESTAGPLGPDHIVPLAKGGDNSIDNILPCCQHCNFSKGDKSLDEFLGGVDDNFQDVASRSVSA